MTLCVTVPGVVTRACKDMSSLGPPGRAGFLVPLRFFIHSRNVAETENRERRERQDQGDDLCFQFSLASSHSQGRSG